MSNVNYNIPFAPTILIPGNTNNDTKNVETLKVNILTDGTAILQDNTISNLLDPVSSTDLATKNYVDTVSSPLLNTISTITTSTDTTYTASQITDGTILRTPNVGYALSGWIVGSGGPTNSWEDVVWSPELGIFVAVSDTGSLDRVITSSDGIVWTSQTTTDRFWSAVSWSPQLGVFCAVQSSTAGLSMTSSDGENWTTFAIGNTGRWRAIVWSPELEIFAATSDSGSSERVMTSPDGENWTTRTSWNGSYFSIAWSPELLLFCSPSSNSAEVMTSPDGITWTSHSKNLSSNLDITWSPELGVFLTVSTGTSAVDISPNGIDWTSHSVNSSSNWCSVEWCSGVGLFIISNSIFSAPTETSPDGINWTTNAITSNGHCSISWSNELKRAVIVDVGGPKNYTNFSFSNRIDAFPTAAEIVTELGATATVGYTFNTFIQNMSSHISNPEDLLTIDLTSTGLTPIQTIVVPDTTPTLATSAILDVSITLTNVGSGTEAAEYIYSNSIYQNEMMTANPISGDFRLSSGIMLPNTTVYKTNNTSTITGSGITYALGQVINTVLNRDTTIIGTTDVLPSKETLNIGNLQNNDTYTFVVRNIGSETLTINPNTGTTIDTNSIIGASPSVIIVGVGESSTISLIYDLSSETFVAYPIINSTF